MNRLFYLVLVGSVALWGCTGKTISYEWEGVKVFYDSSRYEIQNLDEDYGVNFDLVEKSKPDNRAHFSISGDTVYLEADDAERSRMFLEEVDFWWHESCLSDGSFKAEWGEGGGLQTYSLNPDAEGAGSYHPYMGKRDHQPVWGSIAVDGVGLYETVMLAECDNEASRDAFMDIFRDIVYPNPEPFEIPDGESGEAGEEWLDSDGDTWEAVVLGDVISLGYDNMDYTCEILSEKPDEIAFRMEGLGDEGYGTSGLFRFRLAGEPLDTSDGETWQDALQRDLEADMEALKKDPAFEMDGIFSPWYALDADYGQFIRYMGTRSGNREVEGLFASKGYRNCRATLQAEGPDEEAVMRMLSLFEDVRFNLD